MKMIQFKLKRPAGRQRAGAVLGRAWLSLLALALFVGGAGRLQPVQAAPAGYASIHAWLQAEQVGAQRTLCVGDSVQVRVRLRKRVGEEGTYAWGTMLGINISAAVVGSGGVGTISPPSIRTAVSSNPPGAAYFTFKAEKPGTVIVNFRGVLNELIFLGIPVSGDGVRTETLFQVEDCKYQLRALSRWRVPGEANLSLVARIVIAGMVEEGGGRYRGTARVQWYTAVSQVGDCSGTLPPDSQAEVTGQVFGPDEFAIDMAFDTANIPLSIDCKGAGGNMTVPVTPDPVTFFIHPSGGDYSGPQVLKGPENTPGTITVHVKRATGQ
jgi:hypothetical protein